MQCPFSDEECWIGNNPKSCDYICKKAAIQILLLKRKDLGIKTKYEAEALLGGYDTILSDGDYGLIVEEILETAFCS